MISPIRAGLGGAGLPVCYGHIPEEFPARERLRENAKHFSQSRCVA